jgi:excisionase family DNA binding protein
MSEMVAPQTYYVYTLAYPDGNIFYVGKGTSGRIADHEREAKKGCGCHKCHVIREIWASGKPVQKRIVFETLDEQEAFEYERALIERSTNSSLVNIRDNSYAEAQKMIQMGRPKKALKPIEALGPVEPAQAREPLAEQVTVIFTSEQAARMLGVKPRTVINLAKQGKIPAFRVGDLWKFLRSDIQAYIDAQRKQTKTEKAEEEGR